MIEDIITTCGLTAKSGKGNVNDQFGSIIIDLVNRGVLEIKNSKDITTCRINELIRCNYNPFTETEDMKGWFSVYHDNYFKINMSNSIVTLFNYVHHIVIDVIIGI